MPLRELSYPQQIIDWLEDWGAKLASEGEMILIGSGALLWHSHQAGIAIPLPEKSMDVDPITFDEAVAELAYDSIIGSAFEKEHGWHVNLMPEMVLNGFPADWKSRCSFGKYGNLSVIVPSPADLLEPKLSRNEPRDRAHHQWAIAVGLISE